VYIGSIMKRNKSGQFAKGNKGKPKGAVSKKRLMWEELGEYIVSEGAEKYMAYLKSMKTSDFAKRFEAILEYFQPKLSRSDQHNSGEVSINVKYTNPDKLND